MFKGSALLFTALLLHTLSVQAFKVQLIEVSGNNRIEDRAILEKVQIKSGQNVGLKEITENVKRLFETGFFYDITVEQAGGKLVFNVLEKPSISAVLFKGNDAFDEEELDELLAVRSNEILDIKKVKSSIEAIKKKYEEKGFYLVQVDYKIKKTDRPNIKDLEILIKEGNKVKVKRVNLVGNRAISDKRIKSFMANKETGFLGMSGSFNSDLVARDKEAIAFIYQNEGYAQVKVSEPEVFISKDKKSIEITYYIEEGRKYKIGDLSFSGDVDFPEEELLELIQIDENEHFSRSLLGQDVLKLQAKYGDEGYAFANISPIPQFNDAEGKVDFNFRVSKGSKVRIGEINVKGNSFTRDKVVRRELKIFEGELYNESKKRESFANVQRLGFFDSVDFQNRVLDENSQLMDIDVMVKERSTGQLNIGAGYGGFQGFSLQGSVQQTNFLGYGINFGANINYSQRNQQLFNINVTDPYFLDTEYSLGLNIYRSIRGIIDYLDKSTGAQLTLGRRLNDYFFVSLAYKLEKTDIDLNESRAFKDVYTKDVIDNSEGYNSSLAASISYDKRNDRRFPTKGYFGRLSFEQSGLGGNFEYSKFSANARYYQPIVGSIVLRNNLTYGWVGARGEVPLNQLYRLGGPNTLRGYDFFTIAQRVYSQDAFNAALASGKPFANLDELARIPFGGIQQLYYNLELEWSLIKEAGVKGVAFFDAGLADDSLANASFKMAWGLGFRWNSPMGPLRFEWGFPLNPNKALGQDRSNFQFSIMQSF